MVTVAPPDAGSKRPIGTRLRYQAPERAWKTRLTRSRVSYAYQCSRTRAGPPVLPWSRVPYALLRVAATLAGARVAPVPGALCPVPCPLCLVPCVGCWALGSRWPGSSEAGWALRASPGVWGGRKGPGNPHAGSRGLVGRSARPGARRRGRCWGWCRLPGYGYIGGASLGLGTGDMDISWTVKPSTTTRIRVASRRPGSRDSQRTLP